MSESILPLPLNDLLKGLRIIILPHSTDIISFTPQAFPTDILLDLLLNNRFLCLMCVAVKHKSHMSGAVLEGDEIVAYGKAAFKHLLP